MDDMVRFMLQQQFYHMFLFGNKVGTKPIKVDLLLGAAPCSPNLDKFVKAIYNFLVPHCIQKELFWTQRHVHYLLKES
jgi:hypothetical protein